MNLLEPKEMLTEQFCPPPQAAKCTSLDQLPAGNREGQAWDSEVGDRGQMECLSTALAVIGGTLMELGSQEEQEGPQGSA